MLASKYSVAGATAPNSFMHDGWKGLVSSCPGLIANSSHAGSCYKPYHDELHWELHTPD